MVQAADLYPGESKTDHRDAYVRPPPPEHRRSQVTWLDTSSENSSDGFAF